MKKNHFIALLFLMLANDIFAADVDSAETACGLFKVTAAEAMSLRQNGEPIEKAMLYSELLKAKSESLEKTDPKTSSMLKQISIFEGVSVRMAYKKPQHDNDAEKEKAIADHQEAIYKFCEIMGKPKK